MKREGWLEDGWMGGSEATACKPSSTEVRVNGKRRWCRQESRVLVRLQGMSKTPS